MLSVLSVRNVVLIDHTEVHFGEGLNVLSGETGAGKSILLAALGLALGYRADSRLLRQGCEEGEVGAVFNLPDDGAGGLRDKISRLLDEHGILGFNALGEIILRRVIHISGRSRAYVNDKPVNVALLHSLANLLMEVQGHFEQQGLLDITNHRNFLDNYAGSMELLSEYQKAYTAFRDFEKRLLSMRQSQSHYKEETAYLKTQIDELEALNLTDDEEARLDSQRQRLKSSQELIESSQALDTDMQEDRGLGERLQKHIKALERCADDDNAKKAHTALRKALSESMDAAAFLQTALDNLKQGEGSLEEVESRLFHLRALARKHKCEVTDLPDKMKSLQGTLDELEGSAGNLDEQEKTYDRLKATCLQKARLLTEKRTLAAKEIDAEVMAVLPELKLKNASFRTDISASDKLRGDGVDNICFMVQSNPGALEAPIGKIASAGELSRFLLALRSALALREEARTASGKHGASLVFDEVDSGIGGATAHAVGLKLSHLATHRQVILITHSAQAAAFAKQHFFVGKDQKEDSTRTLISKLSDEQCEEEIARMLSGDKITEAAMAQAKSLIEAARS